MTDKNINGTLKKSQMDVIFVYLVMFYLSFPCFIHITDYAIPNDAG